MKKRFISKRKRHRKFKFLLFLVLFILGIFITFRYLLKSNIKIDNKEFVKLLLNNNLEENSITKFISSINKNYKPVNLLSTNYYELTSNKETKKAINSNVVEKTINTPLIYIYNTHQTEEYAPSSFIESEVKPTVMMADYIMEDVFNKNSLNTIVEERSIKEKLNENNWKYYRSYDASRIFIEDIKSNNPSIKYFIDVHRDSLNKDKTTIEINGKSYARTIFLIGLENPNYQMNLEFTTKLNNKLNEKYPGLSKGIYQKGGEGVNGVYNQDNSPYTILIEIGGPYNTTSEVLNSTLAFTDVFMEVISTNES